MDEIIMDNNKNVELVNKFVDSYKGFKNEISKVIVGQEDVIDQVLMSIFCDGHSLLVGVPGLAKTLLVQTISECLGLSFNRIQFTPDLMPSDIIGSEILDNNREFKFIKGPVFSNIILADEINRTPPKTQAALLESMQEHKVTAGGKTYDLDEPFFVLATQNPIEQEGTYPLPEAQLDRFMFNLNIDYPTNEEEISIIRKTTTAKNISLEPIISKTDISSYQDLVRRVPASDNLVEYAVKLVSATRPKSDFSTNLIRQSVDWGAGPRACQYLVLGAKAKAVLDGRPTPNISDIQTLALPILRHRVIPNFNAEAEGLKIDDIIKQLIDELDH